MFLAVPLTVAHGPAAQVTSRRLLADASRDVASPASRTGTPAAPASRHRDHCHLLRPAYPAGPRHGQQRVMPEPAGTPRGRSARPGPAARVVLVCAAPRPAITGERRVKVVVNRAGVKAIYLAGRDELAVSIGAFVAS
jgi:hypothetical protein